MEGSLGRDAVVLSNLVALPAVSVAYEKGRYGAALALTMAMVCSFVFHVTVSEEVATIWGFTKVHGLDDGVYTGWIVDTDIGKFCRRHDAALLIADQVAAFTAIVVTVVSCGWPRPRLYLRIGVALLLLFISEQTQGTPHAVAHTLWHILAFVIAGSMVYSCH